MPNTAPRRLISQLGPSERIEGPFTISNAQMGRTRQDKPYLRCLLRDRTGELPGRMWTIEEAVFRALPTNGFVWIQGETQPYQGELQIIIHTIDPLEPTAEQLADLLPVSRYPIAEMFSALDGIMRSLTHPAMRALAETYLADEHLMEALRRSPAAKSMHHAYIGGLLQHTLQLLRLAEAMLPLYPRLNRDIVLMGLFLHDLGKTRELACDGPFEYTDRGELIGHIVEGAIMLHDKAQQMMAQTGTRLPHGALTVLQHIIVSHHGEPEFGAAKKPSTPEALFIAQLDNLDAKTEMALDATRPQGEEAPLDLGGNFTQKQWALDTKLYKPDPLAG
ncbi:MAG: HD domain-containing protein [Phycisphaeraceae bacterium]|nr:HD domain-containing protein [Phycisphaeraceae bacterium]